MALRSPVRRQVRSNEAFASVLLDLFGQDAPSYVTAFEALGRDDYYAKMEEEECHCGACDYSVHLQQVRQHEIEMAYDQMNDQIHRDAGFIYERESGGDPWDYVWVWPSDELAVDYATQALAEAA
jgi:hypothetical protein